MAKYQIVNDRGLGEIRAILIARHRLSEQPGRLKPEAFAHEVERHLSDGNGAFFELQSNETVSGHTEVHDLSPEAIEWVEEDGPED